MTYYQILGLQSRAQPTEIEMAYRALKGSSAVDAWEQINISMAYQTLMNPSKRTEYDNDLRHGRDTSIKLVIQEHSMPQEWIPPGETKSSMKKRRQSRMPDIDTDPTSAPVTPPPPIYPPVPPPTPPPPEYGYYPKPYRTHPEKIFTGFIMGYVISSILVSFVIAIVIVL